jgi:hypothetical protein
MLKVKNDASFFSFLRCSMIAISKFCLRTLALSLLAVATCGGLTGCATLFNGTEQEVQFESEPTGAEIVIGGFKRGVTPDTLTLTKPGLDEKRVTFVKEGYEKRTVALQKKFATASILNLFGFTLAGFGVDILSGAIYNYNPSKYTVELEADQTSVEKAASRRPASSSGAEHSSLMPPVPRRFSRCSTPIPAQCIATDRCP